MAAIAAGGWVALIVIVIICLIAAVVACFGIFFSSEDTGSDKPMRTVVQEINQEYQAQLDDIKGSVVYDTLVMSGSRAVWPEVLSVYAVKVTSDPDNPQEVATVTPEKEQILRDIFWAMNTISHSTTTESVTTIIESDDGHGNILEETVTETKTTLHIVVSHKTATEMAAEYGFGERQLEHLDALLEEGTSGMWAAVLYGVYGADDQIVQVALTQVGNVAASLLVMVWLRQPCGMVCLLCFLVRRLVRLHRHPVSFPNSQVASTASSGSETVANGRITPSSLRPA